MPSPRPPMIQSLLFSQDTMTSYLLPNQDFSPSAFRNSPNSGHCFSQQTRAQYFPIQKPMSYNNSFNTRADFDFDESDSEYTITTQAPPEERQSDAPYVSFWSSPNPYTAPGQPRLLSVYPPEWSHISNAGHSGAAAPSMSGLNNYCQGNNSLSPYNNGSPSQMSPTMSDSTLSPLYPSSALSTPSSPADSYRPFSHSPASSIELQLANVDNQPPSHVHVDDTEKKYTHKQQLVLFREAFKLPMDGAGPFIPQQMYKPHTTSDRKRYVEEVLLDHPLYFYSDGPTRCGILLKDALHSRTKKLANRDQVVFEGRGPSVSIRLEWPGYRQWSRQIPTKDFRNPPGPITLAKLAKNVAKCVQRFIQERKGTPMEDDADQHWQIGDGPNDIKLEDLVLVSMHHISLGSWQPQLRLVRPREPRFIRPAIPMQALPSPSATANGGSISSSIALSFPQHPR